MIRPRAREVTLALRQGVLPVGLLALLLVVASCASAIPAASGAVFYAHAEGGGGFECLMGDSPGPAYAHRVTCISSGTIPGTSTLLMREVILAPSGRFSVCTEKGLVNRQHCNFGNPDANTPTYGPGKTVMEGRFRCRVLQRAMRCVVISSGRGFLLTTSKVRRVG